MHWHTNLNLRLHTSTLACYVLTGRSSSSALAFYVLAGSSKQHTDDLTHLIPTSLSTLHTSSECAQQVCQEKQLSQYRTTTITSSRLLLPRHAHKGPLTVCVVAVNTSTALSQKYSGTSGFPLGTLHHQCSPFSGRSLVHGTWHLSAMFACHAPQHTRQSQCGLSFGSRFVPSRHVRPYVRPLAERGGVLKDGHRIALCAPWLLPLKHSLETHPESRGTRRRQGTSGTGARPRPASLPHPAGAQRHLGRRGSLSSPWGDASAHASTAACRGGLGML